LLDIDDTVRQTYGHAQPTISPSDSPADSSRLSPLSPIGEFIHGGFLC
jgi:hypothetical protein